MTDTKLIPWSSVRRPHREYFFVATGEVEFQGRYEETGYFEDDRFHAAERAYMDKMGHPEIYDYKK